MSTTLKPRSDIWRQSPSPTTSTRSLLGLGCATRYLLFRPPRVSSAILPLDAWKLPARRRSLVGRKGRGSFDHCQLQLSAPPTQHNPSRSLRLIWLLYLRVVGLCGFISVLKWLSPNTYQSTHTARGVHDMCDLPLPVHVLQVLQAKEPPPPPRGRSKSGTFRGNVSFWYSSGDTADNNIDQASRTSELTRTRSSPGCACVRTCGSVVGPP